MPAPRARRRSSFGGLSIVVDRAGKARMRDPIERGTYPGDGMFAHRDGYNVLFGDSHAAWYGDPQQRLIWQDLAPTYTSTSYAPAGTNMYMFYQWNMLSFGIGFFHHFDRMVDPEIKWNDALWSQSGWSWND